MVPRANGPLRRSKEWGWESGLGVGRTNRTNEPYLSCFASNFNYQSSLSSCLRLLFRYQCHSHIIARVEISLRRLLDHRRIDFLVILRYVPQSGGNLARLIPQRNLTKQIAVYFAAGLKFAQKRFPLVDYLLLSWAL